MDVIEAKTGKSIIKGNCFKGWNELTVEVELKDGYSKFLNDIIKIEGVENAVMVL